MNEDKFATFQSKFPNLFKVYPRSGFALPFGWESLVNALCVLLEWHITTLPEDIRGDVNCAQVKEKFGGLRFYMTQETPYISGAIAMAERLSFYTCEVCGDPGKQRSGGWVRTLCNKHHLEQKMDAALLGEDEEEESA